MKTEAQHEAWLEQGFPEYAPLTSPATMPETSAHRPSRRPVARFLALGGVLVILGCAGALWGFGGHVAQVQGDDAETACDRAFSAIETIAWQHRVNTQPPPPAQVVPGPPGSDGRNAPALEYDPEGTLACEHSKPLDPKTANRTIIIDNQTVTLKPGDDPEGNDLFDRMWGHKSPPAPQLVASEGGPPGPTGHGFQSDTFRRADGTEFTVSRRW